MVVPFSTMIQEIALSNILTKERYAQPNDTLLRYVSGYYGKSAGPIDSAVEVAIKDSLGRRASATTTVDPQASLTMLRNQHKQLSEEEFITRYLRGGAGSASVAESAVGERVPFTSCAELDQITSIIRQAKIRSVDIETGEISISLLR
jgi:pyruvate/oxaloacetate carboxyltransferase